eukprot:jgi/Tetstr1/420526/TSEL_011616.t1
MPEGVSARAPRIPLPPVFSGQTKGWRRWRHQMEAYCNATGMKQAMMMSEHASSDQHFKLYATLTALLPEELLDVIRRHLNDNATSGGQAWAALRTRFEGGHLGRISDMYAVLQSGQQRTETAEAYYHRLDNAFLDLVAEAEEHEDVEAPSHNQVVTQFLAGLRPEYEPIIGILQVTAEHEGRAITWEGDCLKLAQNYSKRIEKNHASEPSAEGYIASGGTKRSAHLATGDGSGPRRLGAPSARWMLANGLQERMWLTLSEMTVAMLLHAGLGREFWALAFCTAMHIRNNVYSRGVGSVPYRRHTGKTPDVAGLRVFGCPAYVHVDAGNRRKLDAKAFRGVFVGYGQESHTYLVWNPATRRVVASRNVIFDEGWRDAASSSKGGSGGDAAASLEMFPQYQALLDNSGVGSTSDASRVQEITEAHRRVVDETDDVEEELEIEEEPLTAEELELGPQQPTLELTQLETNEGTDDGGQEEPIVQRAERDPYPARSRRAPGQWWVVHPENPNDDAAAMMAAAFAAVTQGVDEPITLKQALSGPFKEQWAQAVESEFNSLEKQGTWVVCELPEERTAIPSKWVFKVKYNADGSIARFKARLVVQGCRQRHGIDYAETFAPTVKFTTIRVLFAIAVQYGWNIHQVDVDTAFLYAPVEEEIYMRPPPGYEQYDARGRPMVLRLLKSLYGLKQSPRNWHNTLHKFLVCYGFQQLKSDPGAYVYWQGGQLICILVVYVDDMIFAFKDAVWAADFKTALGARFDIKDLGVCAWALGMAVERDWDNATLKVHQAKYIDDMVHKFNLADAYAVSTPAEVGADVPGSNKPLAAEMPYQALVGSLLYAMVATRPDIAEAVSKLCRVMAKPEERHWQAAKRVLRYLKGTKTLGLTFSGGKADGLLHGYCDADWAGDVVSRRSTTGFVFMLCGAAVSWKSQLQATVALSTAEAEYMALCAAVCEALFLRELLRELCCAQSEATVIFEDNQSCIALTRNPMTHGRSKHIAIKYHFTREKVLSGEVAIEYCPTAQMVADALTKALGRLKHAEFAMQMLGA